MDNQSYVPILKLKKGETEALRNLSELQKSSITPMFELVDEEEFRSNLEVIESLGFSDVYVDTKYIDDGDRSYLQELVDNNWEGNINIIPVLYYDDFPEIADYVYEKSNNILFKVPIPEDIIDGPVYSVMFERVSNWIDGQNKNINLMLDLNVIEDKKQANVMYNDVKSVLNNYVISNDHFNTVILAMTSFPDDLSELPSGESWMIERLDIKIYKAAYNNPEFTSIVNKLKYSDYGVTRFTDSEIDFSKLRYGILPKAKYTTANYYWILKGKKDRETREFIISHSDIAKEIYQSTYYYGENFSFGDQDIMKRALEEKGRGNSTNWVTIAANHHIAVVVDELSTIRGS